MNGFVEILSCKGAREFERKILANSHEELNAMGRAGAALFSEFLKEFGSLCGESPRLTALVGKGHNGGDALCVARLFLQKFPSAKLSLFFAEPIEKMKPNTAAFASLILKEKGSVRLIKKREISKDCDILIEGLFAMNFKPPMREEYSEIIALVNSAKAKVKLSVDLPAGVSDEGVCENSFRADVSYLTGLAKAPIFSDEALKFAGRIRFLNLGFLNESSEKSEKLFVTKEILAPLKKLRNTLTDKRDYGHLFIFAGSANYKGAALMNIRAALRSGVGLVTAFVPESVAAHFAAAEPSAIYIPCAETEDGSLALEAFFQYKSLTGKESAILAGSGLGNSAETNALVCEIARKANCPLIFDADAIMQNTIAAAQNKKIIITPHMGEYLRLNEIFSEEDFLKFCAEKKLTCLLKGALSRICDGNKIAYNTSGGPMLARAGSGDILAGLLGGIAAQKNLNLSLFESAGLAAFWAGKIAEFAFAQRSESAYANSDSINFIPRAF